MKIPEHVVLEDVQCKGYRKKVIKLENGTVVDMRIPDHTRRRTGTFRKNYTSTI